jgi:hypothetical protein
MIKLGQYLVTIRNKSTNKYSSYYTDAESLADAKKNAKEEKGDTHDVLGAILR